MKDKKGQVPVTEVIAVIIAVVAAVTIIILLVYFGHSSSTLMSDFWNAISFSWLFGHV
ncbi:hypothetical protein IHE51_01040 [Candidatus Parvarchaeota archaeon]|jgi:phosphosulfolactate phosphohydrolase-like enzyme|uniref:Uncharacterized protein n=1 Tax=Candidatus Acidifodinimicrobium mancum TaxID=2898728 RepID=A0A8T3V1X2_9ARCH|nr:hypothetical protein [Candidatus Acidifodinimicrobium mancum]MBE5728861.1 hypothetical protein [Candidatus Acidifodinimicrobium mancum]MBE5729433.1 hypothetical protein [Candidatus Acidifodinimicrobium mancum]MBE5730246.1 hypothetical protein [Candidatus Acidifodinimicrobium mancum]